MDIERDILSDIKELLKSNPRGMNVLEIANAIGMNRQSVAKYMEMLVISGFVDVKNFGSAKVYYISQRLPISAILSLSSDFIIVLDKDLRIVDVNDKFLDFYNVKRGDLISKNAADLSFPIDFDPPIENNIKDALDGNESVINAYYKKKKDEYYFIIKFIPLVFDEGSRGVTIIFTDITGQRKIELAIKASEHKLRNIIDQSIDGIMLTDEQGTIIEYNKSEENITGIKKEDALRKKIWDLLYDVTPRAQKSPEVRDQLKRMIKKFLTDGKSPIDENYIESVIQSADGVIKILHLAWFSIRTENGYMICQIDRDITEHKQVVEMLRDSENKYRTLAETTVAPIMIAQGDKLVEVNKAAEMMTGYTTDELLNMGYLDWIHPEYKELVKGYAHARQEGTYIPPYEIKFVTKSGETRWAVTSGGHTMYKGNTVGVVTYQDITDFKKSLESLKMSETILAKAQGIAHVGSFSWDMRTQKLSLSEEDYRILGFGQERPELQFDKVMEIVHPDDRALLRKSLDDVLKGTDPFHFNFRIVRSDGTERIIHTEGQISLDESGKPHMLIGVNQDITEESHNKNRMSYLATFPLLNPNPIIEINETGRINFLNPAASSQFPDLMSLGIKHPLLDGIQNILDSAQDDVSKPITRDVKVSDLYFHEIIQYLPNKKIIRIYLSDITERRTAEDALRESDAALKLARRYTYAGMWSWDFNKGLLQLSDEIYNIFGILRDGKNLTYDVFLKAIVPEDRDNFERSIQAMRTKGEGYKLKFEIIIPGGERRSIIAEGEIIMDGGKPLKLLGVCFDITGHK
jgi:PAS domain S-box-containing protein